MSFSLHQSIAYSKVKLEKKKDKVIG